MNSMEVSPEADFPRDACRLCGHVLEDTFVDLGMSPLCESYITRDQLDAMEPFYPLRVYLCRKCLLVQLKEYVPPENIFSDYAYFSSYSDSWLRHARNYVEQMIDRFQLTPRHRVIELASNDGYLLQYFVQRGIPVLGIDPAANVVEAALAKGVPTRVRFFGTRTARELTDEGIRADLLVANNVFAHVPRLRDFVAGMKRLLAPTGVITLEFPHLQRLMEGNQFDTIYHEHFSYLSLHTAQRALAASELAVFDVEELKSHGGSLRVYARHVEYQELAETPNVAAVLAREAAAGLHSFEGHRGFSPKVVSVKHRLLEFLIEAKRAGKQVVGYGAPGKGNTLLNYCGIREDFLDYTVDRNPLKQGRFLPGTHIPIFAPEKIAETRPDYVLILPWNLKDEIVNQLAYVRQWGGQFVVPIPEVQVLS